MRLEAADNASYFGAQWRVMATATQQFGNPLAGSAPAGGTSEFSRCRNFAFGIGDRIFASGFDSP